VTGARAGWYPRLACALLVALAACGCAGSPANSSVTVLVSWGGAELDAFKKVVNAFESSTGITVDIESTRALSEELGADLQEGNPPDIAALPSAGAIVQYAKSGKLQSLGSAVDAADYGPPWSDLMRPLGGRAVYAVPVKIDVKSLIWYDPAMFDRLDIARPANWTQLLAVDKRIEDAGGSPWCLALATPPTSGWPGADWIADILLSQYGPTVYQKWVRGELPWTSGYVYDAWQTWAALIDAGDAVYPGRTAAIATADAAIGPQPGQCYMQHGALVDEGFAKKQTFPTGYDFFPFPPPAASSASSAIQVSADFIGVFTTTNPLADKLVRYLTTAAVQQQFVTYQGIDGFSANSQVPVAAYQHDGAAVEQVARLLRQRELCFGAADAMPQDLSASFDQAILEYLAAPATLKSKILPELQAEAQSGSVAKISQIAPAVCGTPISASGKAS
jgi:alpha-glucoside transport system substrate-binding protein